MFLITLNNVVNSEPFLCIFKQSVRDAFIQSWQSDKESNQVLRTLYNHIKTDFSYEIYLDKVTSPALRRHITQIRTSGHTLRIKTGRYGQQRLGRFERRCQVCGSGDIEDEFHFVFKCEAYADKRHVYIESYYYRRPSVMKPISLFNSTNTSVLYKLAIFIKKSIHYTEFNTKQIVICYDSL